ncbi:MAG: MoxR family ATPase [Verrucomicrobia bacterium]|nr:MoxR family ATPase [Verrucomicrobiota bacterium]MDA1007217.1 MoxR family ATPase [Verrucomicrobiota bacterium]
MGEEHQIVPLTRPSFEGAVETAKRLEESVQSIVLGQGRAVRRVLACLISGGHLLLEDYPGTGKTTLAKAIAQAIGGVKFSRLQFTPDLLPSDVLGVSVFDQKTQEFRFMPGPVFTDILLADEINRASPRTQSALLESMAERQVTVDGKRYDLDGFFFVVATQNPVEFRGTYPLPEAQMDRFTMQCGLGYVSQEDEIAILNGQAREHPLVSQVAAVSRAEVVALMNAAREVRLSDELKAYIVALVAATRGMKDVQLPASPRASLSLMRVAQTMSLFEGRDFVVPETIQDVAADVIAHRLVLEPEARYAGRNGRQVVEELLESVAVPV